MFFENDRLCIRLWLEAREKHTHSGLARVKGYATEALRWLLEDKIATAVDVETLIVRTGVLGISAVIHRPASDPVKYQFDYIWQAQEARR